MIEVIEQNHVQMPGSVLYTISRSDSLYCKKPPSFWTSRKFTHFFSELFSFIRNFLCENKTSIFSIFVSCMVPEIFAFLCMDTARPYFEETTFIYVVR